MQTHYFDASHPLRPYTHSLPAMPGTIAPANALRGETPPTARPGFHPAEQNGRWIEIEDHRGRNGYVNGQPHEIESFGPPPDGWSETLPPPTPEELARIEYGTALSESDAILTARSFRQLAQTEEFTATEFATFAKAGLFPVWVPGAAYAAGNRIVHEGVVYEVKQPVTAQDHQPPGGAGMLAVYRPISADPQSGEEPDGSLENPHPFISGMDVFNDKYYSFEGAVYLAKADMLPCVWNPGMAGLWQWELAG